MKKAYIGLGVLGIYVLYSLGIRHQQPQLAKPSSLVSGNQGSSSNSNGASLSSAANTSASTSSNTSSSTQASSSNANTSSPAASTTSGYRDGTYTGDSEDAYYGNVQVAVTVSGGKITNVKFLQYPNSHSTSVYINQQAMPYLQQETVQSQNANVQIISGATFTSQAFIQSLQTALNKA